MLLKKIIISNYRGINGTTEVDFNIFSCIVGQNDAGKSTILKAIDAVLNDKSGICRSDYNVLSNENFISIELQFDHLQAQHLLGEEIPTTFEEEEITDAAGLFCWRRIWTVTDSALSKPKTYFIRKKYEGTSDFLLKTEAQLRSQCTANGIETSKGNGTDFNNVEKRAKLREYNQAKGIGFAYETEEAPSSGTTKLKAMADAMKKALPTFQYFKADTSLSDTDTTIQKYFKDMAFDLISEELDTDEIQQTIKTKLESVLEKVTDKINQVVGLNESVQPRIEFDWSKLISTSFVSSSNGNDIPLSSRGDGFRRITMMSYFEYLAENARAGGSHQIIFGFEEPETFLHPSAQAKLFEKLRLLNDNGYQVIVSTHSPTIVGSTDKSDLIHISKPGGIYTVSRPIDTYLQIAMDLGIKPDNTFTPLFSTSRALLLVEGIDDARAMQHNAEIYKAAGLIEFTFDELHINIIPIGGCGSVKHWINLDLFTKLEKPYFIFLDSDKPDAATPSENHNQLVAYGLAHGMDFFITKKRLLENYMHPTALMRLVPGTAFAYGDFEHVKNICKDYPDDTLKGRIGGKNVAERHYCSLTFDELRMTWFDGADDEFLELYNMVRGKIA
jgi:putative ATP-dependent endonuclease of OLD family